MTNTRIARAYPGLSEPLARLAFISEALEMTRRMKQSRREIDAAGTDGSQIAELLSQTGLVEEFETAEETVAATVVELLTQVSEEELREGRDSGLLTPEEYDEALTTKRTMSLEHSRSRQQEHDRER